MLSELNQRHDENLQPTPPRRQGQLSGWLQEHLPHRYGNDPGAFDPAYALEVAEKVGRLYGRGKYFGLAVRGFEALPKRPVMLVSNHSGGMVIPDVWGFGVAWYRHFGAARRLYFLCHELLFAVPKLARFFERIGALRASTATTKQILAAGHDVLVFPGGDLDTWRPYSKRYEVDFGGRTGFARLGLETNTPVVPVAHAGAHETLCVLTTGRAFAKAMGIRRIARAEVWPIHLSLPWGLALGPLPHLPVPGHFRYLVGEPVAPPASREAPEYAELVRAAVQQQLDTLREEAEPDTFSRWWRVKPSPRPAPATPPRARAA